MPDRKPRRKRSHLSMTECVGAVVEFSTRVERMSETSSGGTFSEFAPDGRLLIQLLARSSFGQNDDFFEALRVLARHRLPRKEKSTCLT